MRRSKQETVTGGIELGIDRLKEELLQLIRAAVHAGPVTLTSGKISDFYIDMRLLTLRPKGAYLIANIIDSMLADTDYDAVGGLTIGADPVVGALCYHAELKNKPITGFIVRKETKKHGLQKNIEGPALKPGARVVLIDDVVTTGGSIAQAYEAVNEAGCKVTKAIAVVDRQEGAREMLTKLGFDFEAVFTRADIELNS